MDGHSLVSTPMEKESDDTPVRPLRVLVTGYRSHPHVGGQGVYLRELTRSLTALGHQVSVASGPPYPELDPRITLHELPSLDLFAEANAFLALRPRHLTSWADLSEWLAHNSGAFGELYAFGRRLERFVKAHEGEFDVIHDNQTLATPMLRINAHIPVITTLHHPIAIDRDYAIAAGRKWWERLLTRRWYRFIGMQAKTARALPRHLAVSDAARQTHAQRYGVDAERVRVAFNGLDHGTFRPDNAVPRETGLIVTTASADVPIKGLDVLIEALARVAAARPAARLHIIGTLRDGPAKRMLATHGLSDRVTTSSDLTRAEVAALYHRAHIVACPARFEGFGFPAAEAMACGAAVVASDGGALPEVVGEAGLVSPAGDAGAMAANLARLLDDPNAARQLGEQAAIRARQEFDWSKHALAASHLYVEALAEQGRT
ncbi:glycosyltransferase family 4 protein [Maricaulis maris]|uniref:Glycosyltransferase involved in cell wall biosynthesis n=1 Tax=Maricaulis maris TaxID=74318 RepID=A0A495DE90_9PROT|nr:glycosyltransferase family 4 protein [Maricaulis maris]RKR00215.1 glycosyltransferase involved in cell wall biosynthesis [Maricaulis maris]